MDGCCFNGAALFQVRKGKTIMTINSIARLLQWGRTFSSAERGTVGVEVLSQKLASMGPHFFKCGKGAKNGWTRRRKLCFNGAALFQVRKGAWPISYSSARASASMGPHFFKCGKGASRIPLLLPERASMGPHFFKCGKFFRPKRPHVFAVASMGPHFFKCGKQPQSPQQRNAYPRRFNGAALFQVRKVKKRGINMTRC